MIDSGSMDAADDNCVFCEIVAGRMPSDKVAEDANTLAFMDIDPGADGHLLVIPKHHSADLLSVPPEDLIATTLAAQRIAKAMYTQLGAEGVNVLNCSGAAGWQTVFHFHLHVIPRYHDKSKDRREVAIHDRAVPRDSEQGWVIGDRVGVGADRVVFRGHGVVVFEIRTPCRVEQDATVDAARVIGFGELFPRAP